MVIVIGHACEKVITVPFEGPETVRHLPQISSVFGAAMIARSASYIASWAYARGWGSLMRMRNTSYHTNELAGRRVLCWGGGLPL